MLSLPLPGVWEGVADVVLSAGVVIDDDTGVEQHILILSWSRGRGSEHNISCLFITTLILKSNEE